MRRSLFFITLFLAVSALIATAHATTVKHVKVEEVQQQECLRSHPNDVVYVYALMNDGCTSDKVEIGSVTWHRYFEVAFTTRGDKVTRELRSPEEKITFAGEAVTQCVLSQTDPTKQETTSLFWTIEEPEGKECTAAPARAWAFHFKDHLDGSRQLLEVGFKSEKYRIELTKLTPRGRMNVDWVVKRAILPGLTSEGDTLSYHY